MIDDINTKIALIEKDIIYMKAECKQIDENLDELAKRIKSEYVTKTENEPIKKIVYGVVSIILVAVIGAVIALVVRQVP